MDKANASSGKKSNMPHTFLKLLWLWIALSSVLFIEPAPYDIIFVISIVVALLFSYVSFSDYILLPSLLMVMFINSNLISLIFACSDLVRAISFFLITFYLILTWFFLVGLLNSYHKEIMGVIFKGYVFAALIAALIGICAYFRWIPAAEFFLLFGRVASVFKDPNVFGPFLVPAALYTIYCFESKNNLASRCFWLAIFLILSIGVLLSFSRAAWGNYVISACVYFILAAGSLKQRALTVFVLVIIILPVISATLFQPQVAELLNQRIGIHGYDSDRFGTQLASLQLATAYPLGIGPGQTEPILSYSTHSLYVRIVAEYGFLGILSFLNFLVLTFMRSLRHCFRKTKNTTQYAAIVTATLTGILFNSIFIDTLHWRHFWLFLALPWIPFNERVVEYENRPNSHQNR